LWKNVINLNWDDLSKGNSVVITDNITHKPLKFQIQDNKVFIQEENKADLSQPSILWFNMFEGWDNHSEDYLYVKENDGTFHKVQN
jgi:hypothetical protein